MNVRYLEDVQLPSWGEWTSRSMLDPLHPEHGPLPEMQGLLEYNGIRYTVAVWDTRIAILVLLEMVKDEDPDPSVPLLPIDEVYLTRGWIAMTFRWVQERNTVICEDERVLIPDYPGPKEEKPWEREIYRRVMEGSVRLAVKIPPGMPLSTLRKLAKNCAPGR